MKTRSQLIEEAVESLVEDWADGWVVNREFISRCWENCPRMADAIYGAWVELVRDLICRAEDWTGHDEKVLGRVEG